MHDNFGEDKLRLLIKHLEGLRDLLKASMKSGEQLSTRVEQELDEIDRKIEALLKIRPKLQ